MGGNLVTTEQIQYWLKTGTNVFTRVTEDSTFDPATDLNTYGPTYKDRLNQPEYITGKKTTVEFEIDLLDDGPLHAYLETNEDVVNVPTELVRVKMYREAYPAWAATTVKAIGDRVIASGSIFEVTIAGTTGAAAPIWPSSGTIADDTVTWKYIGSAAGHPIGATGYAARKAAFAMTQNPLDGGAGEAIKATGTLRMTSDGWTDGVFDPETATFTPAV